MFNTSAASSPRLSFKELLLMCGVLSSLWYVAMNIFVPMQFEGYSYSAQTVSEISAIGAPTRSLWVLTAILYLLLFAAFGWGVLLVADSSRALRVVGWLILADCVINIYWPPMHLRGSEPSLTDTLHIVWTAIAVLLMMGMMGFAVTAFGRKFRIYTIATIVLHVFFGILTSLDAPNIAKNMPTPWIGIWERINIGAFMLWIAIFSVVLLRKERESQSR